MLWLTDGDVLLSDGLADEDPFSLAGVEIVLTLVDKDGVEPWDCDALGLSDTFWLRLAVELWDAGTALLDCPLSETDTETFTDALVEDTLELSVWETFLDVLTDWKEPKASRICEYLETWW